MIHSCVRWNWTSCSRTFKPSLAMAACCKWCLTSRTIVSFFAYVEKGTGTSENWAVLLDDKTCTSCSKWHFGFPLWYALSGHLLNDRLCSGVNKGAELAWRIVTGRSISTTEICSYTVTWVPDTWQKDLLTFDRLIDTRKAVKNYFSQMIARNGREVVSWRPIFTKYGTVCSICRAMRQKQ